MVARRAYRKTDVGDLSSVDRRWGYTHLPHRSVTVIAENDFISRVELLLKEFANAPAADEDLCRRLHDTLLEGYSRALALEARCRELHGRQMTLAALANPGEQVLREVAALAQEEARLAREKRELRALVGRLRNREQRLP